MKLPLTTGAYEARSVIAAAQRCVNVFPEQNPGDSEFPTTHYPTPGLVKLGTAPKSGFRGLYATSANQIYAVVGDGIFGVNSDYSFFQVGTLTTNSGPVAMRDNSIDLVIVDGSAHGYAVHLATNACIEIIDPAFYGSNSVCFIDDFLLFNQPGTRQFYASGALALTFDPLDIASKNGSPDNLVTVAVIDGFIWMLGQYSSEVWYNAGGADFAFARYPNSVNGHGCAAVGSIAAMDTSLFWLSRDRQGQSIVVRTNGMQPLRISTHAIENEFQQYANQEDAIGFTHQMGGHYFYVLTFPTADKTWCFDLATGQWHERAWMDDSGVLHRHRASCMARAGSKTLVGDWENGNLYEMTANAVDDAGAPMLHVRSWPGVSDERRRTFYNNFVVDMEVGDYAVEMTDDPKVWLRWSDDRGRSWGNRLEQSLGARGEFLRNIQFNRLGSGRDRVFEVSWSVPAMTALAGAYVNAQTGQ